MRKENRTYYFSVEGETEKWSEETVHVQQFRTALDRMKEAQNSGKNIKYQLGYSNFTFELWIILHKDNCNGHLAHRNQYLVPLNKAYEEHFENLDQYKHEDNFKRILKQLTLNHVWAAIRRSQAIMQRNQADGCVLQQYKGYKYYKENPSLSIWEAVEKNLLDCRISQSESSTR